MFCSLSDTIGQAVNSALVANQEQMNKALKAMINTQHEKSCPNLVLPAQYPQLDLNKIAVHTDLSVFDVSTEFSHAA